MQFDGALISEQGVEFAVVLVKEALLRNPDSASWAEQCFQKYPEE